MFARGAHDSSAQREPEVLVPRTTTEAFRLWRLRQNVCRQFAVPSAREGRVLQEDPPMRCHEYVRRESRVSTWSKVVLHLVSIRRLVRLSVWRSTFVGVVGYRFFIVFVSRNRVSPLWIVGVRYRALHEIRFRTSCADVSIYCVPTNVCAWLSCICQFFKFFCEFFCVDFVSRSSIKRNEFMLRARSVCNTPLLPPCT